MPVELIEVLETVKQLNLHVITYLKEHQSELHKLRWDVFEHLIGEFFASWGYSDVRLVGRDPTTSADIYAVKKMDPSGVPIRYFVEVKQVKGRIGVNVIDQVIGAVLEERQRIGWHLGMIVSATGFTEFKKYSRPHLEKIGIELRDYGDIVKWLQDYKPSDKGLWLPDPLRRLHA